MLEVIRVPEVEGEHSVHSDEPDPEQAQGQGTASARGWVNRGVHHAIGSRIFIVAGTRIGLLPALILLAGVPGSLLGGYCADRGRHLRMFVFVPRIVVAT